MKAQDKFFLWYCKALHYNVLGADNKLKGECKRIFNEFMDARDNVFLVLLYNKEERINFLLFCAAEHGEL